MRLVRIGHRVINMSALVEALFTRGSRGTDYCQLHLAAPEGSAEGGVMDMRPYRVLLQGREVDALESWLADNCDYLTPDWSPAPAPANDESDDGHDTMSA